ncbi:MAG TPA: FMN-binding glutamate synthase family protein [Gammaproteobacteria bacterium]|nr:FMN-binding glutamate synthase family protein [Gammaproteobacteria bacterium]
MQLTAQIAGVLVYAFVLLVGTGVLAVTVMFVVDVTQTKHAVRRNFPVVGRFRYLFERLGEFFRQYFFALDREELPFNRAERSWVYRAAKQADNTVGFGSTRDLRRPGTVIFVNGPWALLDGETREPDPMTIGPHCAEPYTTASIFNVSAMSFGAISRPAVLALSGGAKRAGIWLNTGEGGLSPYHLEGGADLVFQIGTANYGVRDAEGRLSDAGLAAVAAYPQVKMFELKLSQGAKPGKGGILPAVKVTEEIAAIRGIPPHRASLSPNRRLDVASVGQLLDVIARIREVTGKPTGFKAVIGTDDWLDELCDEILKRGPESAPDFITVDSGDGGSGAAPMPLIDNVGLVVRESLPLVVDRLAAAGLRERIRVIASGKMITPAEAAWAFCAGADFVASARGFMFALGCIQSMQCNKNTCPTGIATHDKRLQRGLDPADKAERVRHYAERMKEELLIIAHSCGAAEPRQLERRHCRVVIASGRSVPLDEIFPPAVTPLREDIAQEAALSG